MWKDGFFLTIYLFVTVYSAKSVSFARVFYIYNQERASEYVCVREIEISSGDVKIREQSD